MINRKESFARLAFAGYILLMLWLLFGQRIGRTVEGGYWEALCANCNLVPFRTIAGYLCIVLDPEAAIAHHHAVVNLAGNVLMFVPLGYFLPRMRGAFRPFFRCMLWAAVILLGIECLQLLTLLGSCDIDDLLLNLMGTALGYGVFRLMPGNK